MLRWRWKGDINNCDWNWVIMSLLVEEWTAVLVVLQVCYKYIKEVYNIHWLLEIKDLI